MAAAGERAAWPGITIAGIASEPRPLAPLYSRERRHAIAARARAEYRLRLSRALGRRVRWGYKPLFFLGPSPLFRGPGEITIGDDCRLRGGPVRSRISTGENGRIAIGDRVGINYGAEVFSEQSVTIGDGTIAGSYLTIYDTSFHPVEEGEEIKIAPVSIGANVWLGRHVSIFPGVTIGDHAVVASGTVVTSDVSERVLVGGMPARVIRELRASEGWRRV